MPGPFVPTAWALCASLLVTPALGAAAPAATGRHGMVVTPEAQATEVGLQVLRDGGNSIDAAVAAALALAVTHPIAGNLGGGGFLLYRTPEGSHRALDFRETAPRRLEPAMFLDEDGRPVPGLSLRSGLAVGVPGSVAGLFEAHARWGSRPWSSLVAPAVRLARRGSRVSPWLAENFASRGGHLLEDPEARRIFAADGALPAGGDLLVQKDLARTLKRVARRGAAGFQSGPTAEALAAAVEAAGGVMDVRDLAGYAPRWREPLEGRYRGYRIVSFPPPSSGGVVLLQLLAMLERFDLRGAGYGSSRSIHWMAEAERRAYADRSRWLGDPDFAEIPLRAMLDPDYVDARARSIEPQRATPSEQVAPGELTGEGEDTLHLSVTDRHGAGVSLTTTLNTAFGTGIVAPGTGVLLNNEMDDFALAPGIPNAYGLLGGAANAVLGRKRPLSSMTPTIVEYAARSQRPALVLGSPGGSTIITSVLQVLVNVIDHEMPLQQAVDAPRFHHQWQPDAIRHEPLALPEDVRLALEARGHQLRCTEALGNVNAIGSAADGSWLGAADPRRAGAALGH